MKYRSENQLDIFEFHDSVFSLISFDGEELIAQVNHLNIHKGTEQNPSEHDMEIDCARIVFKGFCKPSYATYTALATDPNGNSFAVDTETFFEGKEAENKITQELRNRFTVYEFGKKDDTRYYIDGCGTEPFFTIEFCFDSVTLEWDNYLKKSWYELHRQYTRELTLDTPEGEKQFKTRIICHEKDV